MRSAAGALPKAEPASDALLTQVPPSKEGQEAPTDSLTINRADPDRKFAKRARDDGPMLWDKAGLERAGQGVIPGAERDGRGALQRQADAPLTAKAGQKLASDLPLFGSDAKQKNLFSLRAYHGSPHDFDKFDISKIGTGEGAQAFGHGLYFAENENVSKWYRDNLSKPPGHGWFERPYKDLSSFIDQSDPRFDLYVAQPGMLEAQ